MRIDSDILKMMDTYQEFQLPIEDDPEGIVLIH